MTGTATPQPKTGRSRRSRDCPGLPVSPAVPGTRSTGTGTTGGLAAEPGVLVLPHPRCIGWPKRLGARDLGELVAVPEALTRAFQSDAHLAAYSAQRRGKPFRLRLTSGAIGWPHVEIAMRLLVIDVDAPEHKSSPAWRAELRGKLEALDRKHPGAFVYFTRGGARVLWRLGEPFELREPADAARWREVYRRVVRYLGERFGIEADASCADWTRLFRVPRARRDGVQQEPETIGNAHEIGAFDLARFEPAAEPAPSRAPSFPSAAPRRVEPTRCIGERRGAPWWRPALLAALEARGEVIGERQPGVFVVRCPNALEHTTGRDGDGSTLLYASAGAEGRIVCLHSHCAHLDHAAWLEVLGLAGGAAVTRRARIERWFIGGSGPNMRVRLALSAADDGGPLGLDYLGVTPSASAARWSALWAAASVEPPSDLDPCGDLGAALGELLGRVITVELDASAGRVNPVRRILACERS